MQLNHKVATTNANQKVWAENAVQRRPFGRIRAPEYLGMQCSGARGWLTPILATD